MSKHYRVIEKALREGGQLHAFMSGGGLRVLRIEKGKRGGKLIAYGEHPTVDEAFRILGDDFKAGGRDYNKVYGKIEEHYLTGQSMPEGELDAWIRKGSTFDARFTKGEFVFELTGLEDSRTPDDTVKRCTAGETVKWTDERGVTYECSPSRFPNGEACCSTRIVSRPKGMKEHRAWMYYATRTGKGLTLEAAIDAAFKAAYVEVDDNT